MSAVFAVAEVIFQVRALGFEHAIHFVLDGPPRPPGCHQPSDIVCVVRPFGDERVAAEDLIVAVADRHLAPVDSDSSLALRRG